MEDICELHWDKHCFDLLVIDTAATFLPLSQRNKRALLWALAELRLAAGLPCGVLIVNQSRNMHRPLAAFADIVLEIEAPRSLLAQRRRTFTSVSRYPQALSTVHAELNVAATDYLPVEAPSPEPPLLATLETLLAATPLPLTRQELLARWPSPPPRLDCLGRSLARGCETGLLQRTGAGTRADAFRYILAPPATPAASPDATNNS